MIRMTKQAQNGSQVGRRDDQGSAQLTLHLDVLAKALKESGVNISGNQYM